jgi:uncharacterized protein (TIGR02246 family)
MTMNRYTTIIGFFLLTSTGCVDQKANHEEEGQKLMQISRDWSRSVSPDSIDRVLSYWAEDAVYMPPGQPALTGREAIRQMVTKSLKIPGFKISWEPQHVTINDSGDMAYLIEKSQITVNDSLGNPKTEYYKALTVWRKKNGVWKNVAEMVNTDPRNE